MFTRCSLFLVRGQKDERHLEAKLFDVTVDTSELIKVNGKEIFQFQFFLDLDEAMEKVNKI